MRASTQEQTGGAGVSEVSAKFQRIGWGPVPNQAHDLGTDLLVQARDGRRFNRGLIVGVQVKAGASWFADEARGSGGELLGWWYYEPGTGHFDDWVTHGLPHLLVLHDLGANTSYWVHVTADRVATTGKGCKILVPAAQTIEQEHVDSLLDVASQQKAAPSIEGTSFNASALTIAPGRRLRYALVAPRLVAPHPNAGHASPIGPEEALALCAHGRFLDLRHFAEKHDSVPDPQQPYEGRDWRWSFVCAVWKWAFDDDIDALADVHRSASASEAKAASGVLLVCALLRVERTTEALSVVDKLLKDDDLGPVDHGWALVQRSRISADIGDVANARADAVNAQRQFQGDQDDVTVSALAAAAAWQLFVTAGFGHGELEDALTASDTAVSWWRTQIVQWALDEASERSFQRWYEDGSTRWSSEDKQATNFFAAELNADITGEHGTWRSIAALAARHEVMDAHTAKQHEQLVAGLDALRRSGDDSALKNTVAYLRRAGPIAPLAQSVTRLTPGALTHTTAKGSLELLASSGDLLPAGAADSWIETLVDLLTDPSAFVERVRPTFLVDLTLSEAVAGVLPAGGQTARARVADFLAMQRGPIHELVARPMARWIHDLDRDALSTDVRDNFRRLSNEDRGPVGARLLGWLADGNDPEAKQEVHARALAGDLNALSVMGAITVLTSEQAVSLIERFSSIVERTVEQAEQGSWSLGGVDGARELALFNVWFPDDARWNPLLALLTHPRVTADDKRGALELVIELWERIPEAVKQHLRNSVDTLATGHAFFLGSSKPLDGLTTAVGIAAGRFVGDGADVAIARLALGSEQERCDAASLLAQGWCANMRPLLASFAADGRTEVRQAAASAVGRLASSAPDSVVVELARMLAEDEGTFVPSALLQGLSRGPLDTALGRELAEQLRSHASARVRNLAEQFLSR